MECQSRRRFLQTSAVVASGVVAGCNALEGRAETRTVLGVYTGESPVPQLDPFERWLGLQHAVVVCFVDANRPPANLRSYFQTVLTNVWRSGRIPMVTWEASLQSESGSDAGTLLQTITRGGYDDVIDRWARNLARWLQAEERRLYFRPLPEMNRSGTPWSTTTPKHYRAAWRRLHRRITNQGVDEDRLQWVWNPNASDIESQRAENYYPGDQFVDWVGIDGYNFGDTASWSTWQSPNSVFTPMLERLRELTDKPIAIPEFASTSRRQGAFRPAAKAKWIRSAFEYFQQRNIRLACWFNTDKETDWAVFGGARGTDSYRGDEGRYHTYTAYKDVATGNGVQGVRSDSAAVLSDEGFTGSDQ